MGGVSLSIPRKYPHYGARGEYQADCAYCGLKYYRRLGRMKRDAAGFLACEECAEGRDSVTLDRLNAAGAATVRVPRPGEEGR